MLNNPVFFVQYHNHLTVSVNVNLNADGSVRSRPLLTVSDLLQAFCSSQPAYSFITPDRLNLHYLMEISDHILVNLPSYCYETFSDTGLSFALKGNTPLTLLAGIVGASYDYPLQIRDRMFSVGTPTLNAAAHSTRSTSPMNTFGAGMHGKTDKQYLKLPKMERLFLISPPSSPPFGWEQIHEDPPVPLSKTLPAEYMDHVAMELEKFRLEDGQTHPQELVLTFSNSSDNVMDTSASNLPTIIIQDCDSCDIALVEDGYQDPQPRKSQIPQTRLPVVALRDSVR